MPQTSPGEYLIGTLGDIPYTRGTVTLNGTATITVAAPQVTANSDINITFKTIGGTVGAVPAITTITPGVGFTLVGTVGDTSVYNYSITG
jgi:hypothetical protein